MDALERTPKTETPGSPALAPGTPQSAQLALGVFLGLMLGLLLFRGYGAWLGARPTEPAPAAALIDLNRADPAELEQVPGIGSGLAKQIVDHRQQNGAFRSVEELRRVKGVGPVTFDKVRAFLRVEVPKSEPAIPEPLVLERKPTAPPSPAPYPRTAGARKLQPGDPPIDVNAATAEQLMQLPGVGAVTAQNILAARAEKPFRTLADLDRVKGIGPKTLEKIKPFVAWE